MKFTSAPMICLLALIATQTTFAFTDAEKTVDRVCDNPKAKLYNPTDMHQAVKMRLITNYAKLNDKNNFDKSPIKGVAVVEKASGTRDYMPVLLAKRGHSRGSSCEAPPFRMQFIEKAIKEKIEAALTAEQVSESNENYMKKYLELLETENIDVATQLKGPDKGIFNSLGDDVKVVTHCGKATWEQLGGKDEPTQNLKLMSEFYLYKILAQLQMPVESVRLANITYFNADGTPAYKEENSETPKMKLAFFREPPNSVAKRCGMTSKADPNAQAGNYSEEPTSEFASGFLNRLIFNNDYGLQMGHNTNHFYNKKGQKVYGVYDFDLSGIVIDGYMKNQATVEQNIETMIFWMKDFDSEMVLPMIYRTLAAKANIQTIIQKAELTPERRADFQKWFDVTMSRLTKEAAAREGAGGKQNPAGVQGIEAFNPDI